MTSEFNSNTTASSPSTVSSPYSEQRRSAEPVPPTLYPRPCAPDAERRHSDLRRTDEAVPRHVPRSCARDATMSCRGTATTLTAPCPPLECDPTRLGATYLYGPVPTGSFPSSSAAAALTPTRMAAISTSPAASASPAAHSLQKQASARSCRPTLMPSSHSACWQRYSPPRHSVFTSGARRCV